jgi:hypothetical protein
LRLTPKQPETGLKQVETRLKLELQLKLTGVQTTLKQPEKFLGTSQGKHEQNRHSWEKESD